MLVLVTQRENRNDPFVLTTVAPTAIPLGNAYWEKTCRTPLPQMRQNYILVGVQDKLPTETLCEAGLLLTEISKNNELRRKTAVQVLLLGLSLAILFLILNYYSNWQES